MNKTGKYLMIAVLSLTLFSCKYETDYRDANYPDQIIYMPAAYGNGQFVIDDIDRKIGELPFPGHPYRYVADLEKREFRVPLSAYRAGVNNRGAFTVDIKINTGIVVTINENEERTGMNELLLIPSDKFSVVNSVKMKDGERVAAFDLVVDLDFLIDNAPDRIFAIGTEISSAERKTNPELSTTAVIIHTTFIKPTADFEVVPDPSYGKIVVFKNASIMATAYQWDFGDGSPLSDDESPTHFYPIDGNYTVKLTATGYFGAEDVKAVTIFVSE